MGGYDMNAPWNQGVIGTQVLPLINDDAPVIRVEAGPGTGKTYGLVRRVQRILHPQGLGVKGDRIAVVAFNRVIAKKLSKDVEEMLKTSPHSGAPVIRTVHGFCLQVIGGDIRILLPHERDAMLYDLLHEHPTLRAAFPKREDIEQALHDHEANRIPNPQLWQATQRWLVRHQARLIGDLPTLLADRMKGGDFSELQFDHVIVDEFQDLTPAEQDLFFRLRATNGQFVALGDPRQSIYAFRGNDRMGLAKLDRHPLLGGVAIRNCPMIECQRCPKELVLAANQLMALSKATPMTSVSGRTAVVRVPVWKTPEAEARGMAQLILTNIAKFPNDDHLAMVTRRQFGYRLRDEIAASDPAVTIDLGFSESILELWPVREAFLFASLICDPDPATWRAWFAYRQPHNDQGPLAPARNAPAYLRFLAACNDAISCTLVLQLLQQPRTKSRGGGGSNLWDRAGRFKRLLDTTNWAALEPQDFIASVFAPQLWPSTDPEEAQTASNDLEILKANALQSLSDLDQDEPGLSKEERLKKVVRQLRYSIATREPLTTGTKAVLRITTLWGGKGLTADHVYVVGLCDEAIPGVRTDEYPGTDADYDDEQRRLFYVSITRAKQTLLLSRAKRIKPGEAKRLNLPVSSTNWHYADLKMSRFLRDIMAFLPQAQPGEDLLPNRR
jgi:superfamily I DNA/RNA helicase